MLIPWADAKASAEVLKPCPMLAGLANGPASLRLNFDASNLDEFIDKLRQRLQDIDARARLQRAERERAAATAAIRRVDIGRAIRRQRLLLNMPASQLADLVDLRASWVKSIEADHELASCLTFMQLMRLVDAVRLQFVTDLRSPPDRGFPRLAPVNLFDPRLIEAAEEFAEYSMRPRLSGEPPPDTDEEMLIHWAKWLREAKGLEIPRRLSCSTTPAAELSVFVALPLSNIGPEEKKRQESVVSGITEALSRIRGVPVRVVRPQFQATSREDYGPEIYLATISRLHRCDFGVAFVTPPATGVGVIARLFANATLPCLSVAESGNRISRMFRGMYFRHLDPIMEFKSPEEVARYIGSAVEKHLIRVVRVGRTACAVRDRISQSEVALAVDRFRIPRRLSFDEAVDQVRKVEFVRDDWLDKFVRDPAVLPTVTLLQFVHIANKLRWHIGVSASGVPCYVPLCGIDLPVTDGQVEAASKSLDGLVAARGSDTASGASTVDDQTVFDAWDCYLRALLKDASCPVRSAADWLESLPRARV